MTHSQHPESLLVLRSSEAVAAGTSPICATCEHFWEAQDQGLLFCKMRRGIDGMDSTCGGPLAGKMFPLYKGPFGEEMISSMCFMTGEAADFGIKIMGSGSRRVLGISKASLASFAEWMTRAPLVIRDRVIAVDANGEARLVVSFARDAKASPKTVGALIAAVAAGRM